MGFLDPKPLTKPAADAAYATKQEVADLPLETVPKPYPGLAFNKRETGPTNVIFMGSSTAYGQGSSPRTQSFTSRMQRILQTSFNPAGISGGYSFRSNDDDSTWRSTQFPTSTGRGLGLSEWAMAAGAWFHHAARTATSFAIYHGRGPGVGAFTVSIDGAAAVTVTPDTTGTRIVHDQAWYSPQLTRGEHTIKVTAVGTAEISHVYVHDQDEAYGVRSFNGALGGTTIDKWLDAAADTHWDRVAQLKPSMILLHIGSNEYSTQMPLEDFRTKLGTLIGKITTAMAGQPMPWLAMLGMHERIGQTALTIPQSEYRRILREVSETQTFTTFHDLSEAFPKSVAEDVRVLFDPDGTHLSNAGHRYTADLVSQFWALPSRVANRVPLSEGGRYRLLADYDADTLTGAADSTVTSWAPSAGGAVGNLPLVTDTGTPFLRHNSINGHKSVELLDATAWMTANWGQNEQFPLTIVFVGTRNRFYSQTYLATPQVRGRISMGFSTATGWTFSGAGVNEKTVTVAEAGHPASSDGPFVIAMVVDGANSRFYINSLTPKTGTTTGGFIGGLRFGNTGSANSPARAKAARIQVYGTAIPDADLKAIISAHATTYGATLV